MQIVPCLAHFFLRFFSERLTRRCGHWLEGFPSDHAGIVAGAVQRQWQRIATDWLAGLLGGTPLEESFIGNHYQPTARSERGSSPTVKERSFSIFHSSFLIGSVF